MSIGTDSRIGFGYRLGDHADFQVQFEIGPQKETKTIGTSTSNKRNVQLEDEHEVHREFTNAEVCTRQKNYVVVS